MRVGIIVLATNKYIKYVPDLCDSIRKFFVPNQTHKIILLTDSTEQIDGVIQVQVPHHPWPHATLLRYHKALSFEHGLISETDYLFQCDADMRFVATVGDEILDELVATSHPFYGGKPVHALPYERNPLSKAYIPPGAGETYYAGGFVGGKTQSYIRMAKEISANIDADAENKIIAIWHDESHLQKYMLENRPSVKLDPSYCYPESWNLPFPKRLLALDKHHKEMRTSAKLFI